jgi:hypothetical protein
MEEMPEESETESAGVGHFIVATLCSLPSLFLSGFKAFADGHAESEPWQFGTNAVNSRPDL